MYIWESSPPASRLIYQRRLLVPMLTLRPEQYKFTMLNVLPGMLVLLASQMVRYRSESEYLIIKYFINDAFRSVGITPAPQIPLSLTAPKGNGWWRTRIMFSSPHAQDITNSHSSPFDRPPLLFIRLTMLSDLSFTTIYGGVWIDFPESLRRKCAAQTSNHKEHKFTKQSPEWWSL